MTHVDCLDRGSQDGYTKRVGHSKKRLGKREWVGLSRAPCTAASTIDKSRLLGEGWCRASGPTRKRTAAGKEGRVLQPGRQQMGRECSTVGGGSPGGRGGSGRGEIQEGPESSHIPNRLWTTGGGEGLLLVLLFVLEPKGEKGPQEHVKGKWRMADLGGKQRQKEVAGGGGVGGLVLGGNGYNAARARK